MTAPSGPEAAVRPAGSGAGGEQFVQILSHLGKRARQDRHLVLDLGRYEVLHAGQDPPGQGRLAVLGQQFPAGAGQDLDIDRGLGQRQPAELDRRLRVARDVEAAVDCPR